MLGGHQDWHVCRWDRRKAIEVVQISNRLHEESHFKLDNQPLIDITSPI